MKLVRAKLCSITTLAAALCMVGWPGSALAATPCPDETWDPATRTLSATFSADSTADMIKPSEGYRWRTQYPCGGYDRPARWIITSAKALDVDLRSIDNHMLLQSEEQIDVTIDLRPAGYSPKVNLYLAEDVEGSRARTIRLTQDGVDLDGDGATDLTILASAVAELRIATGAGIDDIQLRATDTAIPYQRVAIEAGGGDERIVLDLPQAEVSADGDAGNDSIVLVGKRGYAGGGDGHDVINARAVRGGGGYNGDKGNDKLFLGPGNDSIKEEEWGFGNDLYDTGAGNDRIWDYQGHDVIRSGAGNDDVAVSGKPGGWDIVTLGAGNDRGIVSGKTSRARMNAGPGNDTIFFFGSASIYSALECGLGRDRFISVRHDKARNCERLD